MSRIILSIIVPVYNVEKYIRNCIDSILNQAFKDFELILVDDGSLDNSGKICDEYTLVDSRIVVVHKKNGGASSARNVGLDIARGKYITFVDSDDSIAWDTYDYNINILINDETIDILQFPTLYIDGKTKKMMSSTDELILTKENQLLHSYLDGRLLGAVWDKIFRRDLFDNVRFPEGMVLGEDIYVLFCINHLVSCVYFSGNGVYFYHYREGSITKSVISFAKRRDSIILHIKLIELIMKIESLRKYKIDKIYDLSLYYIAAMLLSKDKTILYLKAYNDIFFSFSDILYSNLSLKKKLFVLGIKLFGMKAIVYLFYFKNKFKCLKFFIY